MKIAFNTNYADNPALMSYPNDELHRTALITLLKEIGEIMDQEESVLTNVSVEAASQPEVAAA